MKAEKIRNQILLKEPKFTNKNGEVLLLSQIILNKKIISVKIVYLSQDKLIKAPGIWGLFTKKIEVGGKKKEVTISDKKGISISYTAGVESCSIRFWNEDEFKKIHDYNDETLWKRHIMNIFAPYQLNFHVGNLINIQWTKK